MTHGPWGQTSHLGGLAPAPGGPGHVGSPPLSSCLEATGATHASFPAAPGPASRSVPAAPCPLHSGALSPPPPLTQPAPRPFVTPAASSGHTVHTPPESTPPPRPSEDPQQDPRLPCRTRSELEGSTTHRGAWWAGGPLAAFQSNRSLQSNKSVVRGAAGRGPGLGSVHPSPRLAPYSPLGQGALGPQGSHGVLEGRLSQGGRRGLGPPEIRATGWFLSDAQDQVHGASMGGFRGLGSQGILVLT